MKILAAFSLMLFSVNLYAMDVMKLSCEKKEEKSIQFTCSINLSTHTITIDKGGYFDGMDHMVLGVPIAFNNERNFNQDVPVPKNAYYVNFTYSWDFDSMYEFNFSKIPSKAQTVDMLFTWDNDDGGQETNVPYSCTVSST